MSVDSSELEWAVRLSGQLKTLSELTESLTYRMLELEERFSVQEDQLGSRRMANEQRHGDLAEAMEERLRDTEDRLGRLEDLLRKVEPAPVSAPPLRAIARPEPMPPRDHPHGETQRLEDLSLLEDDDDQPLAS
jgi:hypothetical protein